MTSSIHVTTDRYTEIWVNMYTGLTAYLVVF